MLVVDESLIAPGGVGVALIWRGFAVDDRDRSAGEYFRALRGYRHGRAERAAGLLQPASSDKRAQARSTASA